MRRVEGNSGVQLLECTNPVKNKWRVRWDVVPGEGDVVTYMEEEFVCKPNRTEIRALITDWYNRQTEERILSGFNYEEVPVWLSQENQFNYKAAYDLAVQTDGDTLPVVFKFGTDTEPVYKTFTTIEELTKFYTCAMKYIQDTLRQGWKKKDALDMTLYE